VRYALKRAAFSDIHIVQRRIAFTNAKVHLKGSLEARVLVVVVLWWLFGGSVDGRQAMALTLLLACFVCFLFLFVFLFLPFLSSAYKHCLHLIFLVILCQVCRLSCSRCHLWLIHDLQSSLRFGRACDHVQAGNLACRLSLYPSRFIRPNDIAVDPALL